MWVLHSRQICRPRGLAVVWCHEKAKYDTMIHVHTGLGFRVYGFGFRTPKPYSLNTSVNTSVTGHRLPVHRSRLPKPENLRILKC